MCCQLVSACYTAGGELQKLIVECQAFDQVFNTILCNQEECSVLVQAFDTLYTLSDHGMSCSVRGASLSSVMSLCKHAEVQYICKNISQLSR